MDNKPALVEKDLLEDETSLKYILKLALPMMVTLLSFTIMQFVDRLMVSKLGTTAFAAIVPAGTVSFVPASFALGVIGTLSTFASQCLGRKDYKSCSNYLWQAMYLGLVYFIFVLVIMWPSAPWIFRMLGHDAEVVRMEVVYLRIMLYVNFWAMVIWCCANFFMGVHRPKVMMITAIAGHITNVIFNYLLIFGKFGFPAMGIAGAAWGTFIGVGFEALLMFGAFLSSGFNRKFHSRSALRIDFGRMKRLLQIGFPAGFGFMINVAFFGIILFGLVGRFGKEALAATNAVLSCTNLTIMPIIGIRNALTATVGRFIGKGKKDLAIKQTYTCLKAGTIYVVTMGICFVTFRHRLMSFWSDDQTVITIGMNIFICCAVFQVFDGATLIFNGALRGAGDTLWPAVVSAIGAIVLLGGGGYLLTSLFPGLGALGPWGGAVINMAVVMSAMHWRFRSNSWMKIDLFEQAPVEAPAGIETIIE